MQSEAQLQAQASGQEQSMGLEYDEDWLAITRAYAPYFPLSRSPARYP